MTTKDKKKTADILTERSKWVRIGLLFIRIRPLTFGQIYEMGEYVNQIEVGDLDLKAKINLAAEMLAHYKSAPLIQETFLVTAYRRRWKRRLFRSYILKRLTVRHFATALEVITDAFTANFFLTSIIFLRQTRMITEPSQTTPLGQQSEE